MGLVVNTNLDAIGVHNNLAGTNNAVAKSLQRLSSGLKINSAKDDASGFAIANSFKAKVAAMRVASQNASEGESMLQVADGSYSKINDILVRMKSLATQAASGQTESQTTMNNEFSSLQKEIDRIANSTKYGGTNLLNGSSSSGSGSTYTGSAALQAAYNLVTGLDLNSQGDVSAAYTAMSNFRSSPSFSLLSSTEQNILNTMTSVADYAQGYSTVPQADINSWNTFANQFTSIYNSFVAQGQTSPSGTTGITFQVGANNAATDQLVISFNGATSDSLGVSSSTIGIETLASAQAAMTALDTALTSINSFMGNIGAYQNRLQYTIDNLATGIENFTASASTIEDADMASEISELSKHQILQQAGMAMLAQANQAPQQILTLLR